MNQLLLALTGITIVGICSAAVDSKCLDSVCQVESSCKNLPCKYDVNGDACGAYQIHQVYFQDCCKFLRMSECDKADAWKKCAKDYSCARKCTEAYMNRYGKSCSTAANPSCEDYARVHNGGPKGCRSSATIGYWNKVKKFL